MRRLIAPIMGLLLLSVTTVHAEEGRIPIFEPITITESGRYVVTRPISSSNSVIYIQGNDTLEVDIDLNGFKVEFTGSQGQAIWVDRPKRIAVRNGSLVSAPGAPSLTGGIYVSGTTGAVVGGLTQVDTEVIVEDLEIRGGGRGMTLFKVAEAAVRRCTITESEEGLYVAGSSTTHPLNALILEDNVINVVTSSIWSLGGVRNAIVRNNRLTGGIRLEESEGLILRENSITVSVFRIGIEIEDSNYCEIIGNIARSADPAAQALTGLRLFNTSDCLVADNVFSGFDLHGIDLYSSSLRNRIDRNSLSSNGSFGIKFNSGSTQNVIGRNTAIGNIGGTCTPGPSPVACPAPGVCDAAGGNISAGNNFVPGQC